MTPVAATGTLRPAEVRAALQEAIGRLRDAAVGSPGLVAELLLMHVLGRDRAWLYAHPEELLDAGTIERYFSLIARRAEGTPTQYLTGRQEFWGLEFEVTPDVLIPRPETEHVVEVALERLGRCGRETGERPRRLSLSSDLRIADVGTGSGCLAIALAREMPEAIVFATDISAAALEVARRNALRHGVGDRVHFLECDLLDAFDHGPRATGGGPSPFHLIVSNPPYMARHEAELLPREVREHEPQQALFGGVQGSEVYVPLLDQAAQLLPPGGIIVLELGYNLRDAVLGFVDSSGHWREVGVADDLAGIPRVIAAERV